MDIIEGPLQVEALAEASQPKFPVGMEKPEAPLSDDAVRAAIAEAEKSGRDPMALKTSELSQGQLPAPTQTQVAQAPKAPVDIPQKFLKPDGVVDVEKLKASTEQLDEATKQKNQKLDVVGKSIDDYVREYKEKEAKFRALPNPDKIAAALPPLQVPPPQTNQPMSDDQIRQILENDYRQNPLATTAQLIQIGIEKGLEPLREQERVNRVRENLTELAKKDSRVLDPGVFAAINAKLDSDPDYWKLKNPHKAAWLDVKDELRLGDLPQGSQAQPSRPPSPVLGGGVPPSAPSSSVKTPQSILANLDSLNIRDKNQEAEGDAAIRALLAG